MDVLLTLNDRVIYLVSQGPPAVFYIADDKAGGILVNAPPFSQGVCDQLHQKAPLRYLFLPSRFGVRDLEAWKTAGAKVLAFQEEATSIAGIDQGVDGHDKLTRTIDFLPMAGRTRGTCGLRLRNLPGVLFLGPALMPGPSGWPELVSLPDDFSYETRLMGVFGLRDLSFEYLFTDVFVPGLTFFGPGAAAAVRAHLDRLLA